MQCIAKSLSAMQGFEAPLAAWRVHATASELFARQKNREMAEHHQALSRGTILALADSLPDQHRLRKSFLASRAVASILARTSSAMDLATAR
jgi:hypothetical protein